MLTAAPVAQREVLELLAVGLVASGVTR